MVKIKTANCQFKRKLKLHDKLDDGEDMFFKEKEKQFKLPWYQSVKCNISQLHKQENRSSGQKTVRKSTFPLAALFHSFLRDLGNGRKA